MIFADDRDHLDSLGKLRRPSVKSDSSLSWTTNNPKVTLQAWAPLDSKNGKLLPPATTGRPSSANSLSADNDTGKEDGELPSTGANDMDVTMTTSKPEVDTPENRRDVAGGAESMAVADGEGAGQGNAPSPEGSAKMVASSDETRAAAAVEGETRQQDFEMGEATGPAGEDQIVPPPLGNAPGSRAFRAVLRRENGTSGKRVELEAQVNNNLCICGTGKRNLPVLQFLIHRQFERL